MLATNMLMVKQDQAFSIAVHSIWRKQAIQEVIADLLPLDLTLVSAVDGFVEQDAVGAHHIHRIISIFTMAIAIFENEQVNDVRVHFWMFHSTTLLGKFVLC